MAKASKRNVEIKARIADDIEFDRRVQIAKDLCNTDGELLKQHDIFYKVNDGRLKLRMQVRNRFQLFPTKTSNGFFSTNFSLP